MKTSTSFKNLLRFVYVAGAIVLSIGTGNVFAQAEEGASDERVSTDTSAKTDSALVGADAAATSATSADQEDSTGTVAPGLGADAGTLSFQADIFTGRFTYAVPIMVAPARQGAEPKLALGYSSGGGNSWCGVGWSLDVGYIQRDTRRGVPIVWASTNPIPSYDDSKGFIANFGGIGSRLVYIGGTNPTVYRQQVETAFVTYSLYADNHWEVVDKSGNTFFFGQGVTNQMYNTKWLGGSPATTQITNTFRWALNKVVDANGNLTTFSYQNDGGILYLRNITYNGTTNSSVAVNTVDFNTINRTDTTYTFTAGYAVTNRLILTNIDVKANGAAVCRYILKYTNSSSTLRSLLASVTRYGSDYSSALPPLTFSYQVKPYAFGNDTNWTGVSDQGVNNNWDCPRFMNTGVTRVMMSDINGDGLPDHVMQKGNSPYTYFAVDLNTGTNFISFDNVSGLTWSPLASQGQNNDNWNSPYTLNGDNANIVDLMDINGDGLPDRVEREFSSPFTNFWVQVNLGNNFSNTLTCWANVTNQEFPNSGNGDWLANRFKQNVDLMDVNGDGLPDRISCKDNRPFDRYRVQLNTGAGFGRELDWAPLISQGDTNSEWNSLSRKGDTGNTTTMLADINGDGLPDRIMRNHDTPYTNLWVQFNNGAGFEPTNVLWGPFDTQGNTNLGDWGSPIGGDNSHVRSTLMDINGDGLLDHVMRKFGSPYTNWVVQINTGSGFGPPTLWANVDSQSQPNDFEWNSISYNNSGATFVDLFDINGDGLPDRVMKSKTSPVDHFVVQFNLGPFPDLLNGIDNGIGGSVQVSYTNSTTLDNSTVNGISGLPVNEWVVSRVTADDGIGSPNTTSYSFSGGYFNTAEREFRGFAQATVTDPLGTKTVTYFHQSGGRDNSALGEYSDAGSEAKKGIPFRIELIGNDNSTNKITLNKVEEVTLNTNGWFFPFISQTIVMDYEGLSSYRATARQFNYDTNNGNLVFDADLGEVTNVVASGESFTDTPNNDSIYTRISFTALGNIQNKPSDIKMTSDSGGSNRLRETLMSYDAHGNLTTNQAWLDTASGFITTIVTSYDQYGNPVSATDATGITTITTYDSTYREFPIIQSKGAFTNQFSYDPRSGMTLVSMNPNGLVTSNTFDAFFRSTAVYTSTNAFGAPSLWKSKSSYGLGGVSSGISANYVHRQVNDAVDAANGLESYVYLDGLGKVIQSRAEAEGGKVRISDTIYDQRGNENFHTLPYFGTGFSFTVLTGTNVGTLTEYDPIGRSFRITPAVQVVYDGSGNYVTSITTGGDSGSPVGPVTTAFFDGNDPWASVVIDAASKVRKSYHDARDHTIRTREIVASTNYDTTYQYDLLGNLTNVTDVTGLAANAIRMSYDSLGRKTSMSDPDMGAWTYVYDNGGRLTQQTDAKTNTIKFFYSDPIGRLTRKEVWSPNNFIVRAVTNIYDVSDDPNYTVFLGQLYKVVDSEGYQRNSYDVRGRVIKTGRYLNVASAEYVTQSTYDDADRLALLVYPGNVATNKYTYDTAGNLVEVKSLSGTGTQEIFYTAIGFNDIGQALAYSNGNGALTTNIYYPNSKRLHQVRVTSGGVSQQDLTYSYDEVANLKSISDGVTNSGPSCAALTNVTYDDFHRLTSLFSVAASATKVYAYDATGNVLTNQDSGTGRYFYGAKPHAVTNANGTTYAYDACGNMVARGSQSLTYDEENRLTRVTGGTATVDFGYAADGQRLWKYNESTGQYTIWVGGVYEINNTKTLCHVFVADKRVCTFEPQGGGLWSRIIWDKQRFVAATGLASALDWPFQNGRAPLTMLIITLAGMGGICLAARRRQVSGVRTFRRWSLLGWQSWMSFATILIFVFVNTDDVQAQTYTPVFYYYHTDNLGSSNVMTDRSGVQVQHYQYAAFGKTTYTANSSAFPVSNRYTGQIIDDETGLYYYGARYYDPGLGRFVQPDTIVPGIGSSQALNRYSYVDNNPLNRTDPTGHFGFLAAVIAVIVVAAIGAATGAAYAAFTGGDVGMGALTGAITAALTYIGSAAGPIGSIAGGAAAGAVNAEITGGDIGRGALYGAATSAISSSVGALSENYVLKDVSEGLTKDVLREGISVATSGAESELTGGSFWQGAAFTAAVSTANLANAYARLASIASSEKDTHAPTNEEGQFSNSSRNIGSSDNFWKETFGKFIKLGGARFDEEKGKAPNAPFGGAQGGHGSLFGIPYKPGSFLDHVIEAFSGIHDLLNSPNGYNQWGDAAHTGFLGTVFNKIQNVVNIGLAAPFAFSSLMEGYHPTLIADPSFVDRVTWGSPR